VVALAVCIELFPHYLNTEVFSRTVYAVTKLAVPILAIPNAHISFTTPGNIQRPGDFPSLKKEPLHYSQSSSPKGAGIILGRHRKLVVTGTGGAHGHC